LYRLFGSSAPEVETARATVESSGDRTAGIVLTATGYIVAHHKIEANSKVTGRVAWIGVEKGDHVKEGQVLVRLEDQEFRAQYEQAAGAAESARAQLLELEHGSRPEEIQQTEHNLSEAKATAANDTAPRIFSAKESYLNRHWMTLPRNMSRASSGRIRWTRAISWRSLGREPRRSLGRKARSCRRKDKPLTPNRSLMQL
jgi:hypothetical protein